AWVAALVADPELPIGGEVSPAPLDLPEPRRQRPAVVLVVLRSLPLGPSGAVWRGGRRRLDAGVAAAVGHRHAFRILWAKHPPGFKSPLSHFATLAFPTTWKDCVRTTWIRGHDLTAQ